MERLKNMGLKRSFFLLSLLCLTASLFLTFGIWFVCEKMAERYPQGGIAISYDGAVTELETPLPEQEKVLFVLGRIQLFAILLVPVGGLGMAGLLFYRLKLKKPIAILKSSTERIRMQDLDFVIPEVSADELGQICAGFELMRGELMHTNQELWRQAEERKRLNAAFAHDLRNPVTVLKGTVKQLRQSGVEEQALERLEIYTLRIERYVEAMSGIQRLEQIPVCKKKVDGSLLRNELQETANLLAPQLNATISVQNVGEIELDHGLFLTVVENLIGNAARFAEKELVISLESVERKALSTIEFECLLKQADGYKDDKMLLLSVRDDGLGYPVELLKDGPKPFDKRQEDASHFGMGLYGSRMLCIKHGGRLILENGAERGAMATAVFVC